MALVALYCHGLLNAFSVALVAAYRHKVISFDLCGTCGTLLPYTSRAYILWHLRHSTAMDSLKEPKVFRHLWNPPAIDVMNYIFVVIYCHGTGSCLILGTCETLWPRIFEILVVGHCGASIHPRRLQK